MLPIRVTVCLLSYVLALTAADAGGADAPPNILLILADDQTYHDLGCYGNKDVHTPHIDGLAEQGMRFSRAFTATAMCSPTRQQLYTGIFPVRNGAYPNHSRVKAGTKSLVHHFRELGYRVGLFGKGHIGPADSFPFDKVKNASEFFSRDKSQPFLLVYASHSPHLPWSAGDPSQYEAAKLKLPPYLVDTPQMRNSLTRYYAEITDLDREVGELMKQLQQAKLQDKTIVLFTSEQGAQFPHCKWTCYDTGLRTAMIVRWPGKVEAGSETSAMVQYVDVVPTLLQAVGGDPQKIDTGCDGDPRGGRGFDGRSFLNVLMGESDRHREVVFGVHTTRGIIHGSKCYPIRSIRTQTHKLIWNLSHETEFSNVLIGGTDRGGYWQSWVERAKSDKTAARRINDYIRRGEFELYDLREDPYELNNLADDAAQRELVTQLHKQLKAWMKQQGDLGVETELAYAKKVKRKGAKNSN